MNAGTTPKPRPGPFSMLPGDGRRWTRPLGRWASRRLNLFAVPGAAAAIIAGVDPRQTGLSFVSSPRRANVLLFLGPLPEPLRQAAGIAFAQMPRPRLFVTVGEASAAPELPPPDIALDGDDLARLAELLGPLLCDRREGEAEPFAPAFLRSLTGEEEDDNGNGHEHHHGGGHEGGHHHHGHEGHEHQEEEDGDEDGGDHEHHHDHDEGHDHHDHDHGGGGFMSMVAMTQGMPRGSDGLQMEPVEAHFGPFHPGLPAGVAVKLTLDGDTVRKGQWSGGCPCQDLSALARSAGGWADAYARLYAPLGRTRRSLAELHAAPWSPGQWREAIPALEGERILSHLAWLVSFARLIGFARLQEAAMEALAEAGRERLTAGRAGRLARLTLNAPYLKRRLRGVGVLDDSLLDTLSGPAVRAAGRARDARKDLEAYRRLDFSPVTESGNDALARLQVRLREIAQSLELVARAKAASSEGSAGHRSPASEAEAPPVLETPQGRAVIREESGQRCLHSPLPGLIAAIPTMAAEAELSDALVAIASLDPVPWLHPLFLPDRDEEAGEDGEEHHHHHGGHHH